MQEKEAVIRFTVLSDVVHSCPSGNGNQPRPRSEQCRPSLERVLSQFCLHDSHILVEVMHLNVEVTCLHDRFPEKEEEKEHDEDD